MPILIIEYTFIVSQKYFFCISIVFWCVNSRRPFSTMPADQQRSYKNSDWWYSECNWSISPRRRGCQFGGVFVTGGTEGFHHENLQCGRRRELALGWRRLHLGEQPLGSGLDHSYWYLNCCPISLHCEVTILCVNSVCVSFQIFLLWILL